MKSQPHKHTALPSKEDLLAFIGKEAGKVGTREIARARNMGLAYVYLGYWVRGSRKMDYKSRFLPQERLTPDGWARVE